MLIALACFGFSVSLFTVEAEKALQREERNPSLINSLNSNQSDSGPGRPSSTIKNKKKCLGAGPEPGQILEGNDLGYGRGFKAALFV